jgi:hypothetical protein
MSNRVIVLEGPDCCGKSTLASTLVTEHGFQLIHLGPPKYEDVFTVYTDLLMHALSLDQPVVFDRLHIGETIYGPMLRQKDLLGDMGVRLLHRVFAARDVKMIYCIAGWRHVEKTYLERGDDLIEKLADLQHVYESYLTLSEEQHFPVYNYATDSIASVRAAMFTPYHSLPAGCVGSPNGKILFVGERVNDNVLNHDLPFHNFGHSSPFLNESLALLEVEENFAMVNAFPYSSGLTRDLTAVVKRMPNFRKAIALGQVASKACKDQGIPYENIAHPSAVKRFGTYTVAQYAELIREKMICS